MSQKINVCDTEYEINKTKTNKHCLKITRWDNDDDEKTLLTQKIYFFDEIITYKQDCSFGTFTIKITASINNNEIILDEIICDRDEIDQVHSFLMENLIIGILCV